MKWISVKEKLPALGQHVLAYSMFRKLYAEDWMADIGYGPEWHSASSWRPTHWMPLPAPPEFV